MWPEEYKWKIISDTEDSLTHTVQFLPGNETLQKWSIMGMTMNLKTQTASNLNEILDPFLESALQESPKGKYYIIEKDTSSKNFWVIYKVESPEFPNDPLPESQLWYIIQGNETIFVSFVAIKEEYLSDYFTKKWVKIFKSSRLVYN